MWEEKTQTVKLPLREDRVLALDLNPNRIGLSVLEKSSAGCKVLHWSVYDYPELNTKLKLAAGHTQSMPAAMAAGSDDLSGHWSFI